MNSFPKQRTLATMTGFERYTKKTRRAMFLEEMEQVVPWAKLCALIEPHYPKPGNGRRPKELEQMLRIYFLQQWFNLADPAVEEALYDSATLRQFAGIDLGSEPVPDETTVCKFRHLLEEHNWGEEILGRVNLHLQAKGVRITTGTIVDATLIHAPSSTKNRDQSRDPEMHQTRKGKQWCVSRTGAQARDAIPKMGDGLPEPAYGSRLQTARCCCVQKAWW
jgi:IS5 family transposase